MPTSDGRRARSQRTRAAVAEAMLDCFEDGMLRPSAKQVARRAGVSPRAVFRHFENMEALIGVAAGIQMDRIFAALPRMPDGGPLERRVAALAARATRGFEMVTPVRRAALLSEPFSPLIRERHAWMRAEMRKELRRVLAPELGLLADGDRRQRVAALRALLSFSYWDELRRHERLSESAARRTVEQSILRLLGV